MDVTLSILNLPNFKKLFYQSALPNFNAVKIFQTYIKNRMSVNAVTTNTIYNDLNIGLMTES